MIWKIVGATIEKLGVNIRWKQMISWREGNKWKKFVIVSGL